MKICIKCKIEKEINEFSKDKTRKDSLHPYCKGCAKKVSKPYFDSHKEEASKRSRDWYHGNIERVKKYRSRKDVKEKRKIYMREYRMLNKERKKQTSKQYELNRCREDLSYKLAIAIRKRLGAAIKGNQKSGSAVKDLGCTVEFLKTHLESQFKSGMTWKNWGKNERTWQIDHIQPLCSFDLTNREEFLKACHYTNLQPLWNDEHIEKSILDRHKNKGL